MKYICANFNVEKNVTRKCKLKIIHSAKRHCLKQTRVDVILAPDTNRESIKRKNKNKQINEIKHPLFVISSRSGPTKVKNKIVIIIITIVVVRAVSHPAVSYRAHSRLSFRDNHSSVVATITTRVL